MPRWGIVVVCFIVAGLGGAGCSAAGDSVGPAQDDAGRRDDGEGATDIGDTPVREDNASDMGHDDSPSGETCGNGLDDNGDTRVDEGCGCLPGTIQSCYTGNAAWIDRGICRTGTQGCDGAGEFGDWTECVGEVLPQEDVCGDRLDNDCNGVSDDGPECVCDPGETRPCYDGPAGTRGVGICADGTQTCEAVAGVGWGECLDDILPRDEICGNGLDDDCNGATDDGMTCVCLEGATRDCYSGPRAEVGVGVCRAGTQDCMTGGTGWTPCVGEVGPSAEVCGDALDNDCDGTADEGCPTLVTVTIDLDGDCVTARCPPEAPYPVGCSITMAGSDSRGCVASSPTSPVVYFQEGDRCGAGRVTGRLDCSSEPGAPLNETNCWINKTTRYYPADRSGCPATS